MILFLSLLSLVESSQLLLLASHWIKLPALVAFAFFVVAALLSQAAGLGYLSRRWEQGAFRKAAWIFLGTEGTILGLMVSAAYKLVIYDFQPDLANHAFIVLTLLAALNKLGAKGVQDFLVSFYEFLTAAANRPALRLLTEAGFILFIVLFIYVPDVQAVLARMFMGDQFHHWDLFMAPAWGCLKGSLAYVDIESQYGIGIPMLMGYGSRMLGGFSYEHVFMLLVLLCIIYYLAVYIFLRCWLQSVPIVIIALLIGLKTQMFHTGVNPFVFTYPSATVVRNYFDVFFFICIWGHLQWGRRWFLWAAAALRILAEFNLIDTGVYLIGAFDTYLLLICWLPELRRRFLRHKSDWVELAGFFFIVPLGVLASMYAVAGEHIFSKAYWNSMFEYIAYFLAGPGTIPYSESLHYHFFWASLMGYIVPLMYVASLLLVGLLCYWRKIHARHVLVMVLCVYGLGVYHYYVARTAVTSYYVSGLPFVFVTCFWLKMLVEKLGERIRLNVLLGIGLLCWFCLWTNHEVLSYPNVFNFSRDPIVGSLVRLPFPDQTGYFSNMFTKYGEDFKLPLNALGEKNEELLNERDFRSDDELKKYFAREFDFSADARLVDSLTRPEEKAAVLGNFEVKVLMQADRKPFFYFCPFFMSSPPHMRIYPMENGYSGAYLKKTMRQLTQEKPKFIFMDKVFLEPEVPAAYGDEFPDELAVIQYIRGHYTPTASGKYLVAMKIKEQ